MASASRIELKPNNREMNNFEKATIEYILEMLPRENCTSSKDFHKAMKVIHEATKEWGGSLSSAAEEPINMIEVNAEAERYCEGWREAWKTMGMTMAQQSECEIAYIRGYRSGAESKSSPASVKESLTVEPITAEAFVIQKYGENWLNIMWSPEDVLDAMEEYASLRTVKESLTVEPMTAEEFLAKRNYDPTLAYPHILVVQLMEEYASKPTVEERKVGDE